MTFWTDNYRTLSSSLIPIDGTNTMWSLTTIGCNDDESLLLTQQQLVGLIVQEITIWLNGLTVNRDLWG
jgi:hypothetical protein